MILDADQRLTADKLGWGEDRRAARLSVFDLIQVCQTDDHDLVSLDVPGLIEYAQARGWSDVVKLSMFLGVCHDRWVLSSDGERWTQALLERAEHDVDEVMTALGYALRAQVVGGDLAPVDVDRDLARATVILDGRTKPSSEVVCAHIECAQAYERRDLWELSQRHVAAAQACFGGEEDVASHAAVLAFNRAETEVNWVAALRERGVSVELEERASQARVALDGADAATTMPDTWRDELRILAELVDAICAPPGGAAPLRCDPVGVYGGYVHLARALRTSDLAEAIVHCEAAIAAMQDIVTWRMRLFACAIATELEAARAGHETAGLRWGREQIALRWGQRLVRLQAMNSLIASERRSAEHALMQEAALVDALTGTGNRRALTRFTETLIASGALTTAVAMIDFDRFKSINDLHGHAVGDAVLAQVAAVLRASVREHDLVARVGGDEFLLMFATDDLTAAHRRCREIVETVSATDWTALGDGLGVSVSAGVAYGPLADLQSVCADADAALYRVKQAGGNRAGFTDRPVVL